VLATVNLFATIATAGLAVTATKHVAEHRASDPALAGRLVGLAFITSSAFGIVMALVLVAMSPWLASATLGAPHLAGELRLGALMMALASVNGSQTGVLTGLESFRAIAVANAIRGVATFALVTAGVVLRGVAGAVLGYAVATAAAVLASEVLVRRECRRNGIRISFRVPRAEMAVLWRFSLPALIAGVSFTPATWWSNALLVSRSSYVENGVFNAARNWQSVVLFFTAAVANIGLPMLSNMLAERDYTKYRRRLAVNFGLTSGLALAVAIPVAALARWIMSMYGMEFQGRGSVLVWMCIAAVLMAANIAVGHAIWSLNAARSGMVLALVRGAALVAFSYVFVNRGAEGLAMAWASMGAVQTLTQVPFMAWLLRRVRAEWQVACAP
jgi:O-antigen/teichoic acid export membrane protein